MRKTQCDEDRYARESTLRAKSTLGSESLWKENSRLQEHQQRCGKQPSNPQRFHVTAFCTAFCTAISSFEHGGRLPGGRLSQDDRAWSCGWQKIWPVLLKFNHCGSMSEALALAEPGATCKSQETAPSLELAAVPTSPCTAALAEPGATVDEFRRTALEAPAV